MGSYHHPPSSVGLDLQTTIKQEKLLCAKLDSLDPMVEARSALERTKAFTNQRNINALTYVAKYYCNTTEYKNIDPQYIETRLENISFSFQKCSSSEKNGISRNLRTELKAPLFFQLEKKKRFNKICELFDESKAYKFKTSAYPLPYKTPAQYASPLKPAIAETVPPMDIPSLNP